MTNCPAKIWFHAAPTTLRTLHPKSKVWKRIVGKIQDKSDTIDLKATKDLIGYVEVRVILSQIVVAQSCLWSWMGGPYFDGLSTRFFTTKGHCSSTPHDSRHKYVSTIDFKVVTTFLGKILVPSKYIPPHPTPTAPPNLTDLTSIMDVPLMSTIIEAFNIDMHTLPPSTTGRSSSNWATELMFPRYRPNSFNMLGKRKWCLAAPCNDESRARMCHVNWVSQPFKKSMRYSTNIAYFASESKAFGSTQNVFGSLAIIDSLWVQLPQRRHASIMLVQWRCSAKLRAPPCRARLLFGWEWISLFIYVI